MTSLHILLFIILHRLLIPLVRSASTNLDPYPGAPAANIHFHVIQQSKAESAASIAERILSLPPGYLRPVYGYEEIQRQALLHHIQVPDSRFAVFGRNSGEGWFVASPWVIRRSEQEPWTRCLAFLAVMRSGEAIPLGYATVREGVPPGHTEDLWTTVRRAALTTQQDMLTTFGLRTLVTPAV
ncbi:uncharacterized protein UMAG_05312 [Mycosarcoma maydis]|uniref:Uncharacterized protein n=2 Tax=Mycosarcoma maydis TaxID=5270 RepID=A0A0D1BWA0_MYCMD|nr:uncharacterized protein UMAG_05312 [Ustilago maydis 521]KIS66312.1 hypothetical protein UMAG_05312 [Ustilago maydis 521]|eukprot:XP_011392023.1 hypothetical protein UMAG_05312 [Ustilago maydis 521]